jgi:hypothetical protein
MMNKDFGKAWIARVATLVLLVSSFSIFVSGCAAVSAVSRVVPETKPPAYPGLAGHSVGVMVWADRGIKIDWPSVQLNLATAVQSKLRTSNAPEVKECRWSVQPASIVKYQRDHPSVDSTPILTTAPKLGVERLIYIEIQNLSTRAPASIQLYRGNIVANVQVIEVNGDAATIGFEQSNIRAIYPPKSPPDGVLNSDDVTIYAGAISELATEIAHMLVSYEVERH